MLKMFIKKYKNLLNMDLKEQIVQEIDNNSIILYMKGTKEMPMCGFSNTVVQILNYYGVEYKDCLLYTSDAADE